MDKKIIWSGDVVLPAPVTLKISDEIIWSEDTGRTLSGLMIGDVVAEKKNLSITWGFLTENDIKLIKSRMIAGFFPFSFRDDGINITVSAYRGTLSREILGWMGEEYMYRSANVDIVQR